MLCAFNNFILNVGFSIMDHKEMLNKLIVMTIRNDESQLD